MVLGEVTILASLRPGGGRLAVRGTREVRMAHLSPRPPHRRGLALAALCLAAFVISLDTTIVNVTLPGLVRQLHASITDLQWVVDAYSLVFAALILTAGSLSDRLGRKGTLIVGLGLFGAASLAGSAGATVHELVAARAVMGLGAALIFPATLSLISNIFTGRAERARAIGLWGATTGVGIALGPIVGGWLLGRFWWGSVFVFMAPVAAGIAVLVAQVVPPSRDPSTPPVDWAGLALSAVGMGALVFTIIQAPGWGWGSARTVAGFVASVAVLGGFLAVERRRRHPMLDVGLFKNLRFTAASGAVTVAFFALSGFIFLVTQYFQFLKGYSPLSTGVRLLPVAGSVALSSLAGTRLAVRIGNKLVVTSGLVLLSGAFLWISTLSVGSAYLEIAAQMLVLGTGMGLTSAPATEAIMGVVPKEKAGVGSAVNDATRLLGGTLGVAVIGSVAASLYAARLGSTLPAGLPPAAAETAKGSVGGAVVAAQRVAGAGLQPAADQLRIAAIHAFEHSFAVGCLVALGGAAAGALLAWFVLPARPPAEAKNKTTPAAADTRPVPSNARQGGMK
jgi:EmrB/QacA subfamily drug resistance transporter